MSCMKGAQHQGDANVSKIADNKRKAEHISQKALETFAHTKQRESLGLDDDETPTSNKRSRSAGTDTLIQQRKNLKITKVKRRGIRSKSCLKPKKSTNWPAKRFYEHISRQYQTTTTTKTTIDSTDGSDIEYT